MSLTKTTVLAPESDHALDLDVQVSGMTITAKSGSFRICGVDYELVEDQEFDATADDDVDTTVEGYLVVDSADDSVVLLVEERTAPEEFYEFTPDGPYRPLERLFSMNIPPGTTDLADVEIQIQNIVAPPPPEEPE